MDPPAGLTLQQMARQRATLQATERMRILNFYVGSVSDSIAFCDDQELHEAFNQVEAGVHKMGEAIIKIAEATKRFSDDSAEPQQQQAEPAFLDSSAEPGQQQAEPVFLTTAWSLEPDNSVGYTCYRARLPHRRQCRQLPSPTYYNRSNIPEDCYRAPPRSRWNTAEFFAIFVPDRAAVIVLL